MNLNIIKSYIENINICYLVCNILLLIVLNLYLKSKIISKQKRAIYNVLALFLSIITFIYINEIVIGIFKLKYLSVKYYLLLIIVVNFITLITINKNIKYLYKVVNYTLYILITMIFLSCIFIILGNYIDILYLMDISNSITLMNISFVIFIIYLIIFSIIYIGYYIFSSNKKLKVVENKNSKTTLSREELLNYSDKNNFSINGVDCSIIFEDSNQDNILKNYMILVENIDAKMVNGFTLEENKLLKNICIKLNVNNLSSIDIGNINVLNKISIEEYTFLKSILHN